MPGVEDSVGERLRGEAAEDDRMDRADARAREHRDGELDDHRHVDGHAVALLDAELRVQDVREAAHRAMQLAVRDGAHLSRVVARPVEGNLVA